MRLVQLSHIETQQCLHATSIDLTHGTFFGTPRELDLLTRNFSARVRRDMMINITIIIFNKHTKYLSW